MTRRLFYIFLLFSALQLHAEFYDNLRSVAFENTCGIVDSRNHQYSENAQKWCDWSGWVNGVWTKDPEFLAKHGIVMPRFTLRTNTDTDFHAYSLLNPGQKRQPTHTIEHTVYAIPGEELVLYPYYEMESQAKSTYCLKFAHWYDWQTGGIPVADNNAHLLDFNLIGDGLYRNDNYGYFALPGLDGYDYVINSADEWIEMVRLLNAGNVDPKLMESSILIAADLDFSGKTVNQMAWDSKKPFKGKINGNGHTISNLKISGTENIGLIAFITGGCEIRNIHFANTCSVTANKRAGMLVGAVVYGSSDDINISNIYTEASVFGNSGAWAMGGLIGYRPTYSKEGTNYSDYDGNLIISNCRISGKVLPVNGAAQSSEQNYTGLGNLSVANSEKTGTNTPKNTLKSILIDAQLPATTNGKDIMPFVGSLGQLTIDHCYFTLTNRNFTKMADTEAKRQTDLAGEFAMKDGKALPTVHAMTSGKDAKEDPTIGVYGTMASFTYPKGTSTSLPRNYYIAVDFSQSYEHQYNLEKSGSTITKIVEPIIHFRHLFTIKDGVAYAEMISKDAQANNDYIEKNTRIYDAIKGKPLQVRLTTNYPKDTGVPSGLYYKAGENDYRPIGGVDIVVSTTPGGPALTDYDRFVPEGEIEAARGAKIYRMLAYKPKEGQIQYDHLYVRMLAKDLKGDPIYVGGQRLAVEQFEFNFLGESHASLIPKKDFYPQAGGTDNVTGTYLTDDEVCQYKEFWPEEIGKGENTTLHDYVNFDQYAAFYSEPDAPADFTTNYLRGKDGKYWFKWPIRLANSAYAFGYDKATVDVKLADRTSEDRYEYNEYMIANHSDLVPWNAAVYSAHGNEGLYDINAYESQHRNQKRLDGFFYYINAASDPGTMATLQAKDICLGSTVKVSAWMAEFSPALETYYKEDAQGNKLDEEGKPTKDPSKYVVISQRPNSTANVTFRFDAIKKNDPNDPKLNGERVTVHAFVTGVEEQVGQWMHVYYEFTPRVADFDISPDDVDHYELQVINNCMTSFGADYAVDDIEVYIQNPTVMAQQLTQICTPSDKNFKVKVSAPFENLLQVLFETSGTNKDIDVYYTFIDKELFDKNYLKYKADKSIDDPAAKAYDDAVVRYNYSGKGTATYGTLSFNSTFANNPSYDPAATTADYAKAHRETIDGMDYIVFNTYPRDEDLVAQKQYYISMLVKDNIKNTGFTPEWKDFNILQDCGLKSVFTVTRTSVIKIDGDIVEDGSQTEYCENMQPTIQVNLNGMKEGSNEIEVVEYNAYFDWYYGSLDEYKAEQRNGVTLVDALDKFRGEYKTETTIDESIVAKSGLTEDMIDYIKELSQPADATTQPKLTLYRKSYTFPPLKIPAGQDTARVYVLALPTDVLTQKGDVTYRICSIPTQVALTVRQKAPALTHGIKNIPYPARILDVPIRASLDQLKAASDDLTKYESGVRLAVPIRDWEFSGVTEAKNMRWKTDSDKKNYKELTLIWTNDPEYDNLGSPTDPTAQKPVEEELLTVGDITYINVDETDKKRPVFYCLFDKNFNFKEGYEYQMRFSFEEDSDDRNVHCPGQETFTIRVVPKYLMWVGTDNLNFNNDANWRRIDSNEAYTTVNDDNKHYYTDGSNKSPRAYAPLDFTSVIIPQTSTTPHLFKFEEKEVAGTDFLWSHAPSTRFDENIENYVHQFEPSAATPDIEYDMAAYTSGHIECRPWYANTCEQIHFLPEAEIIGQDWLRYTKAWVDVKLTPYYWHIVSSPLKEVFAGDLYLPTKGAQQKTPLFTPITFDDDLKLNNRFAPAVYQRSYRASNATVYELGGGTKDVAVAAGWSNVYNDVQVVYGALHDSAFSIKIDPTEATDRGTDDPVIFRLPKADTSYTYYSKDTYEKDPNSLSQDIDRTDDEHYRLNEGHGEVYARARAESRFFLVGNPLMCHLDMAKFLKENEDVIYPKYWMLENGNMLEGVFDEYKIENPAGVEDGVMPPMRSFFVITKDNINEKLEKDADGSSAILKLKYSQAMATVAPTATPPAPEAVTVTAICNGRATSSARVTVDPKASAEFDNNRDVELLNNTLGLEIPAQVYTLKDHVAASRATRTDIDGTELGIIRGLGDDPFTLRFDGIDSDQNLALYNSADGTYTDIYPGMEYEVGSEQTGLFIVRRAEEIADAATASIAYTISGREVTVFASDADADIRINVADTAGRRIASHSATGRCTFALAPGIYILQATDGTASLTAKILVK